MFNGFKMVFSILLSVLFVNTAAFSVDPSVQGIVGYDCTSHASNITVLSINSIDYCTDDHTKVKETSEYVTIIQSLVTKDIPITACKVTRSLLVHHCGMHSHSTISRNGFIIEEIVRVSQVECNELFYSGAYKLYNGNIISDIPRNTLWKFQTVIAGSMTQDHWCNGAYFNHGKTEWNNVVVEASYSFLIQSIDGILMTDTSKIRLSSGYEYSFHTGTTFDSHFGYLFWNPVNSSGQCDASLYGILYEGPASLFTKNDSITAIVNTTNHALALDLGSETILCNNKVYTTEHPKLWVIKGESNKIPSTVIKTSDVDMFLYSNSKLIYVVKHFNKELRVMYNLFHKRTCELRNTQLNHLISLAYLNPEQFAWNYAKHPGVAAIMGGEVIYLMSCNPVLTKFRDTDMCYQEFPVSYQNKSMYLKPKTRILVDTGTQVPCTSVTPSLFQIDGVWVELSPHLRTANVPETLSAVYQGTWTTSPISNLFKSGLYTESQLSEYRERIMFPMKRQAIQNAIDGTLSGHNIDNSYLDIKYMLKEDTISYVQESLFKKVYGGLWKMCMFMGGISGFFILFGLLKSIASMILNGTLLYKTFGFSYKILSAIWGTLAKHILIAAHITSKTPPKTNDQTIDIELQSVPSEPTAPEYRPLYPNRFIE